jgi:type II secretory pathway component PulF
MIFQYEAINRKGNTVRDIVEAPNATKAREKLREQGLYVKAITQHDKASMTSSDGSALTRYAEHFTHRLNISRSRKQTGLFARQLGALLKSGMPLARALGDIMDQEENPHFKLVLADIKQKVESGSSFSTALATHGEIFGEMFTNMIRVGENLGSLDMVVTRLADAEEKSETIRSSVKLAMYYPALMFGFTSAVLMLLMIWVVPTISEMYVQIGKELPLPTQIVIGFSNLISGYWLVMLIAAIAGVFLFRRYYRTDEGRLRVDGWKFRVPYFKHLYSRLVVLRFCSSLGMLLQNGVDIIRSLEIARRNVNNRVVEKKIEEMGAKVREGASLSRSLVNAGFLPKMVTGMISVGEASDTVDEMLIKVAELYQDEVDRTIQTLTKLIEPVMILVMGGIIGLIAIAIILPVVNLNMSVAQ